MLATFDAAAVTAALPRRHLIEALREAFAAGAAAPVRHHHAIPRPGRDPAALLLMPAWREGDVTGVKLVHVASGNQELGLPSVQGVYILFDGATGTPLAALDGTALTLHRTAAASALAASFLARPDTGTLALLGAGAMALHLVHAHATVRPVRSISLWNRTRPRAEALAEALRRDGFAVVLADTVQAAVREADIVSCATMSREPLVRHAWLARGTHVDLVGAYTPEMRESDDALMREGEVFVDTFDGALAEAGDILAAIAAGALDRAAIRGDLHALCAGLHPGRSSRDAITVFKSVGTALEDLVAAKLVYQAEPPLAAP